MKCKICLSESEIFAVFPVMNQYSVKYYRCPNCGFICTEAPYWLNEAYNNPIADQDIGILKRNMELSNIVSSILKIIYPSAHAMLDFGGGYGIFTRMMRDMGFDYYWTDKYAQNLFAQHFEKNEEHYDVVTAMELFEHFVDPLKEVNDILKYSEVLIFSTELVSKIAPPPIADWWYYAPEEGQHISFYTPESLELLALKFGKNYVHVGNINIFSNNIISRCKLKGVIYFSGLINRIMRRKSFLESDYLKIVKRDQMGKSKV